MTGNTPELIQDIAADLQDRLPVDETLPTVFITLLADLDAAEARQIASATQPGQAKS